jgi:glycosyltransferase involved in cell wall biosynthesis
MDNQRLKPPKRILMTTDTVSGVWTYALELARALGERAIEVALATMGAPLSPWQREEVREIGNLEVYEGDYKLEWMENPWDDVRKAGEWLLLLEERIKPDVIHLNAYAHGALAWRAPELIAGHWCRLSWRRATRGGGAPEEFDRYRREVTRGLAAVEIVVAPTRAMLRALEENYGALRDGRVAPDARDPALFTPGAKHEFVLSAGQLRDEAKNIAALGRVAPHLLWPVLVAGEPSHPEGGGTELGNVHLMGQLSPQRMAAWLSHAAIFALPARYEPFGLTALEAGLAGCALVLGDIPSLREVWADAALFAPPDDEEALCRVIEELIANPDWRAACGARARQRALEFAPRRMAEAYLAAYADLMAAREAPARGQVARVP